MVFLIFNNRGVMDDRLRDFRVYWNGFVVRVGVWDIWNEGMVLKIKESKF